jgi:hypothetical protein
MADDVRINGNQHGWASVIFKIAGKTWYGIKSIKYGDKRTRTKTYGMGRAHAPRGRTPGKYEVDPVAISMEKWSAKLLRDELAAKSTTGGTSFGDTVFQVVVQYTEGNNTVTDELVDCTWSGDAGSVEEGPDGVYDEIEFDCMRILRNGKSLFAAAPGSAT